MVICVRFAQLVRNVKDLPFERGLGVCYETVRFWARDSSPRHAGVKNDNYSRQSWVWAL
jgi:transposase-like protein